MADEGTRASPKSGPESDPEGRLEAGLPAEERKQPDPALQLNTGRLGAAGWAIFAVVAILILTAVLYGLNGPSETQAPTGSAPNVAAAPNTSPAPTPTAPQNRPGAKP